MKLELFKIKDMTNEELGEYFRKEIEDQEGVALDELDEDEDEEIKEFVDDKSMLDFTCPECGKTFKAKPDDKGNAICKFCGASVLGKKPKKEKMAAKKEKKVDVLSFEETYEFDNMPIFKTGTHNNRPYTTVDLDTMVSNFKELKNSIKPPLKLGHGGQKFLKEEGMPAAGWMTSLKRVGDTLYADFVEVPKRIYGLLKSKAWSRPSAEIYTNFKDETGKEHGLTVAGVALLGADFPAVKSLPDIEALYNSAADGNAVEVITINFDEEGSETVVAEEIKTDPKLLDRIAELEKQLANEKEDKRKLTEKAIFTELVKEGKIIPALEDKTMLVFQALHSDNTVLKFSETDKDGKVVEKETTGYVAFQEFLKSLPKMIDFSEHTEGKDKAVKEIQVIEHSSREELSDEELDVKVKQYMKDNKIEMNADNYAETLIVVSQVA